MAQSSRFTSLSDWLAYQEQLHPSTIDLGLERLRSVLLRLKWRTPTCPVITIGGTNGKGSCVALLDSILSASGYRVGTFISPHLIRYNERIRVGGQEISDASLVAAFERIEAARGETSLTFFEFNTLAALLIFETASLDAIVLEVGLGGRLDAVNVVDADVAIVSSVSLDHCEWLGSTTEAIGREKAGIFRPLRPAVFGSRSIPNSVIEVATQTGASLLRLGVDFDYQEAIDTWSWRCGAYSLEQLPRPRLLGDVQFDNAATVLTALHTLRDRLPVSRASIEKGLRTVTIAGRFQKIGDSFGYWVVDVAHNPAAAKSLATTLKLTRDQGRTIAVVGMFADKDVDAVIDAVSKQIDSWVIAGLLGKRAMAVDVLKTKLLAQGASVVATGSDVAQACEQARSLARDGDRIVVFGSFFTVGPALEWLRARNLLHADA